MNKQTADKLKASDSAIAKRLKSMEFTSKIPILRRTPLNDPHFQEQQKENERKAFVQQYLDATLKEFTDNIFNTTIPYGLFKGIQIADFQDLQAGIAQKFLGIYEFEIAPYFTKLLENSKYDFFVDIGAAEGLYAIVFDRAIKKSGHPATIYAYEMEYCTRAMLRKRLSDNGVTNAEILDKFSVETIDEIDPEKRGFILSDCEGFETELFTHANHSKFANCDMIIETHDNFSENATQKVIDVLSKTHDVVRVDQQPLSDALKLVTDDWFNSLSEKKRLDLLEGSRHPETRWVIATKK
jgi:hypothetical protein